jgi:hypothetical protein
VLIIKNKFFLLAIGIGVVVVLVAMYNYGLSPFGNKDRVGGPLTIKVEDFAIFLIESSDEIYRANVKDPEMWAELREKSTGDRDYVVHYNWLYDSYNSWDEQRRQQLETIMTVYEPHYLAQNMVKAGKHKAGLDEVLKFMRENGAYKEQRSLLIDFYSWYGTNYARPHYEQIKPVLQRKVDLTMAMVDDNFDIIKFIEKETGIKYKKRINQVELQLNMRIIGMSVYQAKKDIITTIQWNRSPEKIWTAVFNEFSGLLINTFTQDLTFRNMSRKLKKDNDLMVRFREDIPFTWDGWIEKNLAEGFARYLVYRNGITKDFIESTYIFDQEYAKALATSFDPEKNSLKSFTTEFIKKNYNL